MIIKILIAWAVVVFLICLFIYCAGKRERDIRKKQEDEDLKRPFNLR